METFPWRRWYLRGGLVGGLLDQARAFGGRVIDQGVSWFLISILVIVILMFVFFARAVLLTPVEIENKQRLEQMSQEPSREYEKYLRDK